MRLPSRYILIGLILFGIAGAGFVTYSDTYFKIKKNFTIFSEVYEQVTNTYIDEVDPDLLIRRSVDAMLEELDPYTVLIDEAESRRMDIVTTGQYAGVGLEIGARGGQLVVIAPIEGYSAERRGIKAGDVMKKVDDVDVSRMTADDLQSLLRGDPGSTVFITIERHGIDEPLTFELDRETIEVKNVTYFGIVKNEPRIGYILLRRFAQNAAEEVRMAILELEEQGPVDGLILDLRNNPGGLLEEAVKIIDKFVPAGERVVWTEGRLSRANQRYTTSESPVYADRPLIVLQNHGSASASEIVSGALQDLDRAVIIGQRSFGKGLVQIVRDLSYNTALKITTSKYFIPSGRSIQSTPFVSGEDLSGINEVPDSLRTRFLTREGRTVYEGIGIEPDIVVNKRQQSMFEIALLQNSHYFFFINEHVSGMEEMPSEIHKDRLLREFYRYLKDHDFSYTTRAERHLEGLKNSLDESVLKVSGDQIEALYELIEHKKEKEKEEYANYIYQELEMEFISRFEGHSGRMAVFLESDQTVFNAISLLNDPEQYFAIFQP